MKKKIIPFGWLPASWGLRGKTRERAEAEYYLEGHELDAKIVDIEHEPGTKDHAKAKAKVDLKHKKTDEFEYAKRLVEIDYAGDPKALAVELLRVHHTHGKISDYDFAITSAELTMTGDELALRKLDIDFEVGKIEKNAYEKAVANIKKEPYIAILDSEYEPQEGVEGLYFEFDWNEHWIALLQQHGYNGFTEEELVKQWFEDLCRSVIHENMQQDSVPFNSGRIINQVRRNDGRHSDFS
jgi:hypothetical protein